MNFAAASIALQAFGAGSSAVGSFYSARNAKTALTYQAQIADINAQIADLGARSELLRGQREEQRVRLNTAGLKGRQRASLAASGVDLGSQSAVNILTSTDVMGEIDANTVAANAVRSAWGYQTQAMNQRNEATTKRATASAISPVLAAGTSLLNDAGRVASSWYTLNKAGAFNTPAKSQPWGGTADDPWYG